jgi:hypothetical protein
VEHLGEMQGPPSGALGDLLAAAEAVGHDERARLGGPDGRKQHAFADSL